MLLPADASALPQPWQMRPQRSATGSAFIIDVEKKHIITNAHVVRLRCSATAVLDQNSLPTYPVLAADHQCDHGARAQAGQLQEVARARAVRGQGVRPGAPLRQQRRVLGGRPDAPGVCGRA